MHVEPDLTTLGGPVPRDVAEAMEILGDPVSFEMVRFLRRQPWAHQAQIIDMLGSTRGLVSRRLLDLESKGLIKTDTDLPVGARQGQMLHYAVNEDKLSQLVSVWRSWMQSSFPEMAED